jgi:crotonobetainyl-CoA:carnitine CoA-transferase CaiB-like acyl-CoA transferase
MATATGLKPSAPKQLRNAYALLADHGPIQVHGVGKVPARRAPNLSEHADEILSELGFDFKGIEGLRPSGVVSKAKVRAA